MFSPKVSKTSLKLHEKPVQSGLAITPSDIERLAQQGVHFGVIVGFSIIPSIIVQIWRLITEAIKSRKEKKQ